MDKPSFDFFPPSTNITRIGSNFYDYIPNLASDYTDYRVTSTSIPTHLPEWVNVEVLKDAGALLKEVLNSDCDPDLKKKIDLFVCKYKEWLE